MKISAKSLVIPILALACLLSSCEFSDSSDDYAITPMVLCSGGTASNNFTVEYYVDNEYIITDTQEGADSTLSELPLGKKGIVTVTATKADETSSMTIIIYKNNKMDRFSNLASCTSSTYTSCSNTLVVYYDVDDDSNLTKSASSTDAGTDSDSSSTSSESESSSSSSE
ncbi:MAG TPA: hypothetical protein PKX40_12120 [Spirochaetota bacterium]|nr:hypothetical protein [Spirochaetota bacterium]